VVVLVPKTVEDAAGAAVAGLHPGFTVAGSVSTAKGGSAVPVEYAWPEAVSPAPGSDFSAANMALEQYPRHISVRLGSLRDRGFYQSQLIYSLSGSSLSGELAQFRAFGGLLAANTLEGIGTAPSSVQPPWEEDLWTAGFQSQRSHRAVGREGEHRCQRRRGTRRLHPNGHRTECPLNRVLLKKRRPSCPPPATGQRVEGDGDLLEG